MSVENAYLPIRIKELVEMTNIIPYLHKCRVSGTLNFDSQQKCYVLNEVEDTTVYSIKILFDEISKIPEVITPVPVQIFGEVMHDLNLGKQESFLKVIIVHILHPSMLNTLKIVIKEIRAMDIEEEYGFDMESSFR